ncbi:MAG TPA: hypothetical protein DET40_23810 [Lentisphaeria bacterium]|nr:MAG: hypothetical protein A2X45_24025 [Lentisphaerae bacterium GWF2_50_93]HCE46584.1 hypothetical protein [Lentisphaeria bacterium]
MEKNRIIKSLAVCMLGILGLQSFSEDPVKVELNPVLQDSSEIRFAKDSQGIFKARKNLNVALLKRIVLKPDDVKSLDLELNVVALPRGLNVIASGENLNNETADFAKIPALRGISLSAGESLLITAYKKDWHWNGGAVFTGLAISADDGSGKMEPSFPSDPMISGPIGDMSLAGKGDYKDFPDLTNSTPMLKNDKGGFGLKESSLSARSDGRNLSLHHNGRNDKDKSGWAPCLVFTAKKTGTYSIEGTAKLLSGNKDHKISWLIGIISEASESLKDSQLSIYRVLKPGGNLEIGAEVEAKPVFSAKLDTGKGKNAKVAATGIETALGDSLSKDNGECALLFAITPAEGKKILPAIAKGAKGTANVKSHPKTLLFDHGIKPRNGVYATMKDGKLFYGDKRLKLWGMVKDGTGERVRRLGFNCVRVWFQGSFYTPESAKAGKAMEYVKGDGSALDRYDRMMADYRENGIFVMLATTVGSGTGQIPIADMLSDDSWLAGGADWPEWKKAAREIKGSYDHFGYVDDRFWKARIRHAENVFTHINPYTGKRYAEDEIIALIEINNEAGLAKNWLEHGFSKWPAYFRDSMQRQWNAWLEKKYKDEAGITAAWKKLDQGESLSDMSIKLEPILASHSKYPKERQCDFTRFIYSLIDSRNQEYMKFCRSLAPKGVGVNVVPFSFDSQYRPSIPWLYTNWLGDTSTVSMYFWSTPSMLTNPPGLYVLDSHRLSDKLSVIYETQRGRPSPYRAEFPYMLSVFTSWQDFDVVVFHGSWFGNSTDEQLLAGTAQPPTTSHLWTGVHLEHDQTMTSAIAMAGRIFLNGEVETAPNPAVYTVGSKGIFSFDTFNGIGGKEMSLNTFTRGTRIKLEPERDCGVLLDGKELLPGEPVKEAVKTGNFTTWDWQNGRLIIDSPTVKVYTGKTVPSYSFKDGITISGFNTPFISFALISADGKPLLGTDACRKAYVSAVLDCKNTGFAYDYSTPGGPVEQAKAVRNPGIAPIVVDKVSYTLSFPVEINGRFTGYDFALRQTEENTITGQNTIRKPEQTLWMGLLEFSGRGKNMDVAVDPSPGVNTIAAKGEIKETETTDLKLAGIFNPLPALSWGDNYNRAHRSLRDGTIVRTSITPQELSDKPSKTISLKEASLLLGMPSDIDVIFSEDKMSQIAVTFTQAPSFADLVAKCKEAFGKPVREKIVDVASEQSEVQWSVKKTEGTLLITATEVQGVVRMRYVLGK